MTTELLQLHSMHVQTHLHAFKYKECEHYTRYVCKHETKCFMKYTGTSTIEGELPVYCIKHEDFSYAIIMCYHDDPV